MNRVTLTDDLLARTLAARAFDQLAADTVAREIAADAVLEAARTPQARRSHWPSSARWKLSLAAGAVALAAVVGIVVIGRSTRPAVRDLAVGVGSMDARVLDGGRYRSRVFEPNVELTIPAGRWVVTASRPSEIELRAFRPGQPEDESGALTIVHIESVLTAGCGYGETREWSPVGGGDPGLFMDWLRSQLPANLGAATPVTIAGRPGLQVELQPSTDLRQTCDYGFVLTDVGTAATPALVEIPIDGRPVRLATIGVSGRPFVVMTAGPWTNQFGDTTGDAEAVIASITLPAGP